MYEPDFIAQFEPYLDYEPYLDENEQLIPWKDRKLVKTAPQSAIDAFNEFKELEADTKRIR
jgi:hypothetical protein